VTAPESAEPFPWPSRWQVTAKGGMQKWAAASGPDLRMQAVMTANLTRGWAMI